MLFLWTEVWQVFLLVYLPEGHNISKKNAGKTMNLTWFANSHPYVVYICSRFLFQSPSRIIRFFEGAHLDFPVESIQMWDNCLLRSFWKCELNFNTFVLFECKANEIYSANFRNVNNCYANRHALLRDSLSKKMKIIIADLTCNKKTYPLNCPCELKPKSSL